MITIDFQPLEKKDKPLLDCFFRARRYENSHFNFTNFYMWRKPFHVEWCVEDDVLYIKSRWRDHQHMMQPFGAPEKMPHAIENILAWFKENNLPFIMSGLEKSFTEDLTAFPGVDFKIIPDPDNYDYVYNAKDLIELGGRKYHTKKNHLNAFRKFYPNAEYLPITEDIIPACREELNRWYEARRPELPEDPFIGYELCAIHEVFDTFKDFQLKGAAISIGGRIAAFSFGEALNEDTAVIHVEKADVDVRGAYAAINQYFVAAYWSHMTYINREEDMGLETLRRAKEAYRPVKRIEKFTATL
ncbi:MAG: DUF2156 domain-containing protein [Selenomonadaceae bacterium]|nr:DUF2156 domain-containing protein [Selenomonadaceae bacterium]